MLLNDINLFSSQNLQRIISSRINLLAAALILCAGASAQDETYHAKSHQSARGNEDSLQAEMYLVPFQDKLFNCMFSKEIMRQSDVTFEEMKNKMKAGFMRRLSNSLADSVSVLSYLNLPDETVKHHSDVTQASGKLNFRELPSGSDSEEEKQTLKERLTRKKEKKKKEEGTYIKNGQIVSERTTRQKFMDIDYEEGDLLYMLRNEYGAEYVLSINQFDLRIPPQAGQLQIQHGTFEREVHAHYSLHNTKGESLHGGIAVISFPPNENNLDYIIEEVFPELAQGLTRAVMEYVEK